MSHEWESIVQDEWALEIEQQTDQARKVMWRGWGIVGFVWALGVGGLIYVGEQPEHKQPCHRGLTLTQFVALHPGADEDDFAIYTATTPTIEVYP